MNEDAATSLDRLVDIVKPAPVSAWPLAPGWWVLAAAALALIVTIGLLWARRHRRAAYRREALRELDRLGEEIGELPSLLKRVALCAYPREQVAALNGTAWIDFLNSHAAHAEFDTSLTQLNYRDTAITPAARAALLTSTRRWIREHRPPPPC